ncbi:MAG: SBBP repeat-containing protein, partial [Blastocatellia bacterium]|nr:SBBP repeat-containing protein [Blastocatellia bacterium]
VKRKKEKGKSEELKTHHASRITHHSSRITPEVGFEVGDYDPSLPLVIDPVLAYSTYLGGSSDDQGTSMTVDSEGNAYVVGTTDSIDFPAANGAQSQLEGTQDAFVAKLDASGARMLFITYLGGDDREGAGGIALDSSGNLYVAGYTASTNFPTMNPFQPNKRGETNAFVTKFGPTGNLLYSTYLGGRLRDFGTSIAVDQSGNIHLAGVATSPDFPVANAAQGNLGGAADVYVAKLNAAGNQLLYSTYLGGADNDGAASMAIDPSGNAYVTGVTFSPDFRTANAIQGAHNGGAFDAFVTKLNPSGALVYSTYLGGGGADRGMRMIADVEGNAYVTGDTDSENFPTMIALQPAIGGSSDAFLVKLNPQGSQFVFSTYLGGSNTDGSLGIARDSKGGIYLTGFTSSSDFPTRSPVQATGQGGTYDAFVAKVHAAGTALELSTYLGGTGLDSGIAVATDERGNAYVMGLTDSTDFPSRNGFQADNGGGAADLFIARIGDGPAITDVRIQGKHVIITGEEFEAGAVILLDGEVQKKTKFKSATSLKGKKVAKKIAPGAMVRLQVRNPDGTTSAEFSFTRAN